MDQSFRDRVAIITGGAQGIGEGAATGLARLGADVVVADLNGEGAARLASDLRRKDMSAAAVEANVTRTEDVAKMVQFALRQWGRIDILVNAAGGFARPLGATEITDEAWYEVINLNLTSTFLCCRAVIEPMKTVGHGRIINVSSEAGRMPLTLSAVHYAAAKAGVLGLTRHLARELGSFGITVNAVAPGTTLSPRVAGLYSAEQLARISQLTPLGRVAEVEEQVGPILFLASEAAAYVTGATLDVNGGRLMF